jgi:hypothetical protein
MSRTCGTLVGMTEPVGDTPTAAVAPAPRRRWSTLLLAGDLAALWPAMVGAFILVLAIAFAMSFHGLFVFGREVMEWALGLCILAPLGLDVLSMVGLLATFIVRDAPARVRAYMWAMFGSTVVLSVAGNATAAMVLLAGDAPVSLDVRGWTYRQVAAVVGAAVWPVAAAAALHALIVVRRHLDRRRDKVRHDDAEAEQAAAAETALQSSAIVLAAAGTTVSDILAELELGEEQRRSVERWTKPVRDALAPSRNGHTVKTATRPVKTTPPGRAT